MKKREWETRNGYKFEEHRVIYGEVVRTMIYVDAYDFQSHANAHVWKDKWEYVCSIPYPHMTSIPREENGFTVNVQEDTEELFEQAYCILSGGMGGN